MRKLTALAAVLALTAGCSAETVQSASSAAAPPPPDEASTVLAPSAPSTQAKASDDLLALRNALQAYVDAFVMGDPAAFEMLSQRCHREADRKQYFSVLKAARNAYGKRVPMLTFTPKMQAGSATVTATFADSTLGQKDQRWVKELGQWKLDFC